MDPFQLRLECLGLVRRLTASQQSIGKVVDFLVKHAAVAADDMWDCVLGECGKTSLNAKLNILFLIDALVLNIVDPSGISSSSASQQPAQASDAQEANDASRALSSYAEKAVRDLEKIVAAVVPSDNWDAVRLNASSAQKVLASWKRLGITSPERLEALERRLQEQKAELSQLPPSSKAAFSQQDILRRIEEDRERHKRLRERAWILPAKTYANCLQPRSSKWHEHASPTSPAHSNATETRVAKSSSGSTSSGFRALAGAPDALDIDFEQMWDTTSDLNEDDFEQIREEDATWWGGERFAVLQQGRLEALQESMTDPVSSKRPVPDAANIEERERALESKTDASAVPRKRPASSHRDDGRGHDSHDTRSPAQERDAGAKDAPLRNRWRPIGGSGPRNGGFNPVQSSSDHRSRDNTLRHRDTGWTRREHDRDRDTDRDRGPRREWGTRA